MRFCVVNLGCKVNRVESDAVVGQLREAGAVESPEETADIIVINTCTVTGEADRKARKATCHALRANRRADVVVTGCAAAISGDELASIDERVHVVLKPDVSRYLADSASDHDVPDEDADKHSEIAGPVDKETGVSRHMRPRTRVGVKI